MFVDTHCHLTMMVKKEEFIEQSGVIAKEASDAGVGMVVTVSTTLADSLNSIAIAQQFKEVWTTVGIHPCDCADGWQKDFKEIIKLCGKKHEHKIVALGETGLDFYHKPFFKKRQIDVFTAHIECALEYNLPVVVHIRESVDTALAVLGPYKGELRGVAHCFSQQASVAQTFVDWGFFLGVGGPISYPKNDRLREMISHIPLENLLLETDSPFLPPQQFRGKQNHPKYIPLIAQVVAQVKDVDVVVVEEATTMNAKILFGLT